VAIGLAIGSLGPLAVAGALAPFRDDLATGTVGLVLLVPTVLAAAVGGPVAAVVAVAGGSLTHNLLFTVPLLTLRMTEPAEVAALLVHTLVAAAVSAVVVREQRAATLAADRLEASDRLAVLEEVDRARTALLGAVSHDLRTPLAAIAAAASDLRDDEVAFSPAQQEILLDTIAERAMSLDRTVGQLLDASRLQVGAVTVLPEAVEVQDLVQEALDALDPAGADRVRLRVSDSTPPAFVDPVLVVAALRNLLDNALRHGPDRTPVLVEVAGADRVVVLSVTDRGPGMGDDAATLFEPFHSRSGGPGLGLAIARGFVELHGGTLTSGSSSTGGAVLELTLPAIEEPEG
jgi:two-component system, OmpR family, sensor histidine kinase KdpD